jgi:hypothetical protein
MCSVFGSGACDQGTLGLFKFSFAHEEQGRILFADAFKYVLTELRGLLDKSQ